MSLPLGSSSKMWRRLGIGAGRGLLPSLVWLAGAALGGTFVLGCDGSSGGSDGSSSGGGSIGGASAELLAIATSDKIQLYSVTDSLATSGSAATPFQTITAPNVQSVAIAENGSLYYMANTGTIGSDASFFACPAPATGGSFSCSQVGGTISGGQWLAVDPGGKVFVTALGAAAGAVLSFDAASGPGASTKQVYTSIHAPMAFGGLAVDDSDTVYVTEQSASFGGDSLFSCSTACWLTAGSQTDLTATVTAGITNAAVGGPLAINSADGITLYVGGANASTSSPATLPVAIICTQGAVPGLSCKADSATFVMDHGGEINTLVSTAGIAADGDGDVFTAVLLDNFGDSSAVLGPSFFGFQSSGSQFDCSGSPQTCPVNLLPSVPDNSTRGAIPYGIAIGIKTS